MLSFEAADALAQSLALVWCEGGDVDEAHHVAGLLAALVITAPP